MSEVPPNVNVASAETTKVPSAEIKPPEAKPKETIPNGEEQELGEDEENAPPVEEDEYIEKIVYTLDPKLHDCLYGYFPLFQRKGTKKKAGELDERQGHYSETSMLFSYMTFCDWCYTNLNGVWLETCLQF